MSVVFQIAGKCRAGASQKLAAAFQTMKESLHRQPGHQRALLLVNHATLQFQLMFYWDRFEDGLAYQSETYPRASAVFTPLIESRGTLITSLVDVGIGAAMEHDA